MLGIRRKNKNGGGGGAAKSGVTTNGGTGVGASPPPAAVPAAHALPPVITWIDGGGGGGMGNNGSRSRRSNGVSAATSKSSSSSSSSRRKRPSSSSSSPSSSSPSPSSPALSVSCIATSTLLTKASLAMIIWSIFNIFITALLVENLSEHTRLELKDEVMSEANDKIRQAKHIVGRAEEMVERTVLDAEEKVKHGLRNIAESKMMIQEVKKQKRDGARKKKDNEKDGGGGGVITDRSNNAADEPDDQGGGESEDGVELHHPHAVRAADRAAKPGDAAGGDDAADIAAAADEAALVPPTRRFPRYGTPEFTSRCPWTAIPPPLLTQNVHADHCTFLVRPAPRDQEGLAAWAARIPTEYMMARQVGCRLKLSYGEGVDVTEVWSTLEGATENGTDSNPYDWVLTSQAEQELGDCNVREYCFDYAPKTEAHVDGIERRLKTGVDTLAIAPVYRYAAHGPQAGHELYRQDYTAMVRNYDGQWNIDDAAACAFGHTVQLSPGAVRYEPDLFTKILPTLYGERSLVMAIYTRSLNSDKMAQQERRGEEIDDTGRSVHTKPQKGMIDCAQKLERQFLSGERVLGDGVDIDTVVWFVVSDSRATKNYVADEYGDKEITAGNNKRAMRKVISTNAVGTHTRRKRDPNTADFAQALIDWHLLGETDLIIGTKGYSFQTSAAVRTSTPYYSSDSCEAIPLIYDREGAAAAGNEAKADDAHRELQVEDPALTAGGGKSKELVPEPQYSATARFPQEDSKEFKEICSWTDPIDAAEAQCTILVRPKSKEHEGLAMFVSTMSVGYIIAKQKKCNFKMSYGEIDLHLNIIRPEKFLPHDHVDHWIVPSDYTCNAANNCYEINSSAGPTFHKVVGVDENEFPFAEVPVYRHAYSSTSDAIYRDRFNPLRLEMPDLSLQTAFACSMAKIIHISPHLRKFEKRLKSEILPALEDEKSLVITVYYRTGHAEKKDESDATDLEGMDKDFDKSLECAQSVEKRYLDGSLSLDRSFTKVVWNVVSDSPYVKQEIESKFGGKEVTSREGQIYPRRVIFTGSRGAHTKTQANPTVQDFAEGFIDWYLIGESDAVVAHKGWSFGLTGALRTARPVFQPYKGCSSPAVLVHEGDGKGQEEARTKGKVNLRGADKKDGLVEIIV